MELMINPTWIYSFIGFLIAVYSVYSNLNNKSVLTATKLRELELRVQHLEELAKKNSARLDNQDEQNKVLVILNEQFKIMSEDIKEIKQEVKQLKGEMK